MSPLRIVSSLIAVALVVLGVSCQPEPEALAAADGTKGIVEGIDTLTGLIAEGDYLLVKGNCLACHSANLITQNRATAAGWNAMIDWMQEKQGLADLGINRQPIVTYLATYYAPEKSGRRPALKNVEWYRLREN
jgi:hypothetical protein